MVPSLNQGEYFDVGKKVDEKRIDRTALPSSLESNDLDHPPSTG